ncbi:DUF1189 family protein [Pisciglobus halotolerans]|uniref:Maltodextrin utilization protein YvdJ n=1 Tax=Pisciglobus halotolerans TaxID=745365 RepID=A0A1I3AU25_9LACT|nr:DUF1189 family protein [Pisciglobus halotolerans]SFH53605.1 Maltodextrin utilization protein YvdJ [Pisciglobus halotolerans]
MKLNAFPLNYFKQIWTPSKLFAERRELNVFQLFLIIVFLTSLMIVPVSIHYATLDSFPMEGTFKESYQLVDDSVVQKMEQMQITDGQLEGPAFEIEKAEGIVGAGLSSDEVETALKADNALIFQQDAFLLKEGSKSIATVPYTKDVSFHQAATVQAFKAELSRQWLIQNQAYLTGVFSLLLFAVILTINVLLVAGSALFLYLTKRSRQTSITSYKESVSVMVSCLSLPTFAAAIIGIFRFDIITMISIQTIGMVLLLLLVYFKTQFRDAAFKKESIYTETI